MSAEAEARPGLALAPGLDYYPDYLDRSAQQALLAAVQRAAGAAPPFVPRMPRPGKPFSVRRTNCGPLGWVSDGEGSRYQPHPPETGKPWPPLPALAAKAWADLAGYGEPPDACLVNFYEAAARMGLHQDRDEADFSAPSRGSATLTTVTSRSTRK